MEIGNAARSHSAKLGILPKFPALAKSWNIAIPEIYTQEMSIYIVPAALYKSRISRDFLEFPHHALLRVFSECEKGEEGCSPCGELTLK